MIIPYKFNDGTVSNVEVNDEIGSVIIESRKAEQANNRKHRYHCLSLDAVDYEGMDYADSDDIDSVISGKESIEEFYEIYDTLTETQKRRVEMLEEGLSLREIARQEGKDFKSIYDSIAAIRKKFSNISDKTPHQNGM